MIRIRLCYARPHMHLAEAVTGPDGEIIAGAGTTLTPAVVKVLVRLGVESAVVREADQAAYWEEDKELPRSLADLEARFAHEPADPLLDALKAALRHHLIGRATRPGGGLP